MAAQNVDAPAQSKPAPSKERNTDSLFISQSSACHTCTVPNPTRGYVGKAIYNLGILGNPPYQSLRHGRLRLPDVMDEGGLFITGLCAGSFSLPRRLRSAQLPRVTAR